MQRGNVVGVRILEQTARGDSHAAVAQAVGYGAIQVLSNLLRKCADDGPNCSDDVALAVMQCLDALSRAPPSTDYGARTPGVSRVDRISTCGAMQPLSALAVSPLMNDAVQSAAVRPRTCQYEACTRTDRTGRASGRGFAW